MALTEKNQLLIAFKKLYGKSHTSAKFGVFNESIGSSVQLGASTIFGSVIPSSPSGSLYSITQNIVEKIKFDLVPISLSTYASTLGSLAGTTIDDEGDTAVNGVHAYRLVLPSDYVINSSNPKKGTGYFINSATASVSNGALQLVPPSFGDLYTAEISSSSGIIGGLDDEDYYLDYYSGILFIQDIGRTPTAVTAYAYVGDFVSDIISDVATDVITEVIAGTNLTGGGTSGSVTVSLEDNISLTSVTASLYGTASWATTSSYALNAATASYVTASNIDNFTSDVRSQFSAGTNISITSGTISTINVPTVTQVSGAISNFATRAEVTGALSPYALSIDVSSSFTTPAQVTGAFSVVTAKNAETASYALNTTFSTTNIQNAYNRLRYKEVGFFDHTGSATVQLPTSSLGGAAFPVTSLDYINVNVSVLDDGTWVNDIFAVSVYTASNHVYVDLWAPDLHETDKYKLLAINQDPSLFII